MKYIVSAVRVLEIPETFEVVDEDASKALSKAEYICRARNLTFKNIREDFFFKLNLKGRKDQ